MKSASAERLSRRRFFRVAATSALAAPLACSLQSHAGCPAPLDVKQVLRMSPCELDGLFAAGTLCERPNGPWRGKIILRVDTRHPYRTARVQGLVWKGKEFYPDGAFTNRWLGFRAISSHVHVGPSWFDGQPCLILDYPAGTPVFGNARDELRAIAPAMILGRFYERCPCPKHQGFFVLEPKCGHGC